MKRLLIILLGAIALFASGCNKSPDAGIQQAVQNYNKQLSVSLSSGSVTPMAKVAAFWEKQRIELFLSQLSGQNHLLDAKLLSLKFTSVSTSKKPYPDIPDEYTYGTEQKNSNSAVQTSPQSTSDNSKITGYAKVTTQEQWVYQSLDLKTKKPDGQAQNIKYLCTYFLEQDTYGWRVANLVTSQQK